MLSGGVVCGVVLCYMAVWYGVVRCGVVRCESGTIVDENHKCDVCKGARVRREKSVLEVHIDKGAPDRHQVTFKGQGDESVCVVHCSRVALAVKHAVNDRCVACGNELSGACEW